MSAQSLLIAAAISSLLLGVSELRRHVVLPAIHAIHRVEKRVARKLHHQHPAPDTQNPRP
jgi:hypothetical protein